MNNFKASEYYRNLGVDYFDLGQLAPIINTLAKTPNTLAITWQLVKDHLANA